MDFRTFPHVFSDIALLAFHLRLPRHNRNKLYNEGLVFTGFPCVFEIKNYVRLVDLFLGIFPLCIHTSI